ncbi:MAG TPA: LPS assembly lipoprotein LptE [Acetobacteraceae bacterium]|nr:LPS assembly lipoprotein LptE [Acetobacteraceae bacterium]
MRQIGRRQVVALGLALSGCGFQPVYMPTATGKAGVAQRELAAIHVNLIPDRPGQELRQALQDRLELAGGDVKRRYDLQVGFSVAGEGIAIQNDDTATRVRLIGTAIWTLTAQDSGKTKLSSGFAKAVDAMNILDSQYFALDLENEAVQKRIAETLADQITMQLAAFFRKRTAAAG